MQCGKRVYIYAMRQKKCGDERILAALAQMSSLYRNPLIHPEVALAVDEAISLLGMAHSVVTSMLASLPVIPPTTTGPTGALEAILGAPGATGIAAPTKF
jgi:hypothetical protein